MEKTIRLCMFDMGGVVARHSDASMERLLLQDFGIIGFDSFNSFNPMLPALLAKHSKAEMDEEQMWQQFSALTGVIVPDYKGSLWGRYFKPELDPNVVAIIEELKDKGHRVVCATNTEEAHYKQHDALGQYNIFDAVYASLELGEVKPELAFFEKILAIEQMNPENVVFIDDLAENCEAASGLGINAIQYADPAELRWFLMSMGLL